MGLNYELTQLNWLFLNLNQGKSPVYLYFFDLHISIVQSWRLRLSADLGASHSQHGQSQEYQPVPLSWVY